MGLKIKRVLLTPVYWAIGWIAAVVGERMYGSLDIDFDDEEIS